MQTTDTQIDLIANKLALPQEVQQALTRYEELYFQAIESHTPTLLRAVQLLQLQTSKQVRPLLLSLVANCFTPITDTIIQGSVFIELLHVSTLVHDDIIDESRVRRGVPSMNAIFDNRKAVLIGDFLLSIALTQAIQVGNESILMQLAQLGRHLSEGEIVQMDTAELGNYSEARYLEIIDRKTASLIEVSMKVGALLAGQEDEELLQAISRIGTLLGRAFQIKDDIFDFLPPKALGKPSGQDLKEHKVTLPLIYALQQGGKEQEKILKLLRHEELTRQEIAYIIDHTKRAGGIDYATSRARLMIDEAKQIIVDYLPDCDSRTALLRTADYIIEREK